MVKLRHLVWTFLISSAVAFAQSTLTQIQDLVVNSNGQAFNGTVVITWNGFTGPNGGTVSPLNTSAHIYNGVLSVLLVPSTTAAPGAYYEARYNSSDGTATWGETWQVPPSNKPLTLTQVRTGSTQNNGNNNNNNGSQYATLPISIDEITGLGDDLSNINSSIDGLTNSLNSLTSEYTSLAAQVTALQQIVDQLTNNGANTAFVDANQPAGTIDGTNVNFTLAQAPAPSTSLSLYRNGVLQTAGVDYTLSGALVTFKTLSTPKAGDVLSAYYRVLGTGQNATFVDVEIPAGTIDGVNLTFTLAHAPNPPASLRLSKNGILLMQGGDYTLSGSTITFANTSVTPTVGDALVASYRY